MRSNDIISHRIEFPFHRTVFGVTLKVAFHTSVSFFYLSSLVILHFDRKLEHIRTNRFHKLRFRLGKLGEQINHTKLALMPTSFTKCSQLIRFNDIDLKAKTGFDRVTAAPET